MRKSSTLFLTTTDTVVGLGGVVSEETKKEIYSLKKRASDKNIVIAIGSLEQARTFESWNLNAEKYAEKYWPGAVTLVIDNSLALRIPANERLRELILEKGPIYLTSANISGNPPLTLSEAIKVFDIDEYYDFGPGSNQPSSIIDVRTGRILR